MGKQVRNKMVVEEGYVWKRKILFTGRSFVQTIPPEAFTYLGVDLNKPIGKLPPLKWKACYSEKLGPYLTISLDLDWDHEQFAKAVMETRKLLEKQGTRKSTLSNWPKKDTKVKRG